MPSLGTQIYVTILIAFAWLTFVLVFLAFQTGSSTSQTLLAFLLSGAVAAAAIGLLWVRWALRP